MKMDDDTEAAEPVGYGKPPKTTRFKKGVSGNPKGRPRGSLNIATVFIKALCGKVVINEHGRRKTVTKFEAALMQLNNKAASGDLRAVAQLVALAQDIEAKQNMPGTQEPVISDLDQEVMDGILKRLLNPKEQGQEEPELQGGTDGDSERG